MFWGTDLRMGAFAVYLSIVRGADNLQPSLARTRDLHLVELDLRGGQGLFLIFRIDEAN
jgi:hypothetical protein